MEHPQEGEEQEEGPEWVLAEDARDAAERDAAVELHPVTPVFTASNQLERASQPTNSSLRVVCSIVPL